MGASQSRKTGLFPGSANNRGIAGQPVLSPALTSRALLRNKDGVANIVFVTGTDTGVGKTVLTGLLVRFLRQRQVHTLAMKPFCSGPPHDVDLLWEAQEREISREQVTPFHYQKSVAPLAAARMEGAQVVISDVLRRVRALAAECELLLVEGAGGVLAPLGERFTAADVIDRLECPALLVSSNRLGTVNHTLLSLSALAQRRAGHTSIVLVDMAKDDASAQTNLGLIEEFSGKKVAQLPHLGPDPLCAGILTRNLQKVEKTLAQILRMDTFSSAFRRPGSERRRKISLAEFNRKDKVNARSTSKVARRRTKSPLTIGGKPIK
jgi:dethiobiotin synthetase